MAKPDMFGALYQRVLAWSSHRYAPFALVLLSFFEAFAFPIPPEVLLAPMCLAEPIKAFRLATMSLFGSLAGTLVGYALGKFAFALLHPMIAWLGWEAAFDAQIHQLQQMMSQSPWQVFGLLLLAGFTPIPLKLFTWASGVLGVPIWAFLTSMALGRGKRVFLVALVLRLGGVKAQQALQRWIEPIGWLSAVLFLAILGWGLMKVLWHV